MKFKIVTFILTLLLMAAIPLAATAIKQRSIVHTDFLQNGNKEIELNTKESIDNNDNKIICKLVTELTDEIYCDETIKAIAVLINSDYRISPNEFDINKSTPSDITTNSDDEYYKKIVKIAEPMLNTYITINGNIEYIPYNKCSNGNTYISDKNNNLVLVASPWDYYSKDFEKDIECIGVSIDGIDYLCKNGYDYKQALKWYLPKYEITQ
ncbi:MAG: hypothetical protein MJ089_04975 [Ruminococcus sp.]|nr:hypothetical protein [Ruminococcus sp.]